MPSRAKRPQQTHTQQRRTDTHIIFFPLLVLTLCIWLLYRSLFTFPVWFDESIGKALFFGLPVWFYVVITGSSSIPDSFSFQKLQPGLLLGLAVGGVFGFVTTTLSLLQSGSTVEAAWLFTSERFWGEFALALLTAFWETLLFYSFIMTVILEKFPKWSMARQVVLVAIIFLLFHIPNAFMRFSLDLVLPQLFLLTLFGLGQALLFAGWKNAYALILSHAIWGMVLLVHAW